MDTEIIILARRRTKFSLKLIEKVTVTSISDSHEESFRWTQPHSSIPRDKPGLQAKHLFQNFFTCSSAMEMHFATELFALTAPIIFAI